AAQPTVRPAVTQIHRTVVGTFTIGHVLQQLFQSFVAALRRLLILPVRDDCRLTHRQSYLCFLSISDTKPGVPAPALPFVLLFTAVTAIEARSSAQWRRHGQWLTTHPTPAGFYVPFGCK